MDSHYIHPQEFKGSTTKESEFIIDTVNQCLTDYCRDCTGSYSNEILRHRLICKCQCGHNKKEMWSKEVGQPAANAVQIILSNSKETSEEYDYQYFFEVKDKHFDYYQEYSFCDICAYNGYPNEKVVYQFDGLRSEDEDGFIYKFIVYDYPIAEEGKKIKHVHKYNRRLIDELVNIVLSKETGVRA